MERIIVPEGVADAILGSASSTRMLEAILGIRMSARGNEIMVDDPADAERVTAFVAQLAEIARLGHPLRRLDVEVAARLARDEPGVDLRSYLVEAAIPTPTKKLIY